MPVTIPITLPDDVAEKARAKGLLSPDSLAMIIGEAVKNDAHTVGASINTPNTPSPSEMDPRLDGAINPLAFKRGTIVGDVISPLEIKWEADA